MQFSSSSLLTLDKSPTPKLIKEWCDEVNQALVSIFELGTNNIDFASLLRTQYLIVSNNGASLLYQQLSHEIDNRVKDIKKKLHSIHPTKLMQTLSATWKHYLHVIDALRSFCPHLEQSFASPGQFFSLPDYALKRWYVYILSNTDILTAVSNAVIAAFNIAREGQGILPPYITNMASMLSLLDPLSHSIATFFIEDRYIQEVSLICGTRRTKMILASQQATQELENAIGSGQSGVAGTKKYSHVIDYCSKVELWISQELTLCQQVLSPSTCQRVKAVLLDEFISQADAILVEDQFDGLLRHFHTHSIPEVSLIYHLLTLTGTDISVLVDEIKALIREDTTRIVTESSKLENPVIFVNAIYSLFQSYTQVIKQACYNNTDLLLATQNSIEYIITGSNSAPRLLSLYIDQLLRTAIQTIALTNTTTHPFNQKNDQNSSRNAPLQTASTYANTLSPSLLTANPALVSSVEYQAALQARHRVFFELEIQVQKWLDLVHAVSDKDLFEENHRLLAIDRLLLNIHGNYGYDPAKLNLASFLSLLGTGSSTTNGSLNGVGLGSGASFPALTFVNAHTTAASHGMANMAPNPTQANANLRFVSGLASSTSSQPVIAGHNIDSSGGSGTSVNGGGTGMSLGLTDVLAHTSSMKLFQFFEAQPNVPLFLLLEYYIYAKLSAPQGPQIPAQQLEALLRDISSSARLQTNFLNLSHLHDSILHQWQDYLDSLGVDVQHGTMLRDASTNSAPMGENNKDNKDNDTMNDYDDSDDEGSKHDVVLASVPNTLPVDKILISSDDPSLLKNNVTTRTTTTTTVTVGTSSITSSTTRQITHLVPKTLYQIYDNIDVEIGQNNNNHHSFFPTFVPTVVTQGVWTDTISPSLPSTAASILPKQSLGSTIAPSDSIINASLLKTAHVLYPTLKIPFEVLILLNLFQENYTSVWFRARKLIWNYNISSAVITASFKHPELGTITQYDLICTFFQLLILNLFNYKEVYTYNEIADLTGIINPGDLNNSIQQFHSALLSLSHPKVAILIKTPNTPQMDKTHQFTWNHHFYTSSRQFYIPKINVNTMKNLTQITGSAGLGGLDVLGNNDKNAMMMINAQNGSNITQMLTTNASPTAQTLFRREAAVDAAIVRLLKQHNELSHADLITKVQEKLQHIFTPEESFIKQRIEQQIDQFNIERDEDDRKMYRYL